MSKNMAKVINIWCSVLRLDKDVENQVKLVRDVVPFEWYADPKVWRQFIGILTINSLSHLAVKVPPPEPPPEPHTPPGPQSTAAESSVPQSTAACHKTNKICGEFVRRAVYKRVTEVN